VNRPLHFLSRGPQLAAERGKAGLLGIDVIAKPTGKSTGSSGPPERADRPAPLQGTVLTPNRSGLDRPTITGASSAIGAILAACTISLRPVKTKGGRDGRDTQSTAHPMAPSRRGLNINGFLP
jgi:hypothetical protein